MHKICIKCGERKELGAFYVREANLDGRCNDCSKCRRLRSASRYRSHPEAHARNVRTWRAANAEKDVAVRRRARSKWAKTHQAEVNVRNATRHASKMRAIPAWANEFYIAEIYDLAVRRTASLGTEYEVDHIVPLRGKLVRGLHVEYNLRVIPALDNVRKGNRHWPDMPELRM